MYVHLLYIFNFVSYRQFHVQVQVDIRMEIMPQGHSHLRSAFVQSGQVSRNHCGCEKGSFVYVGELSLLSEQGHEKYSLILEDGISICLEGGEERQPLVSVFVPN
jgi:hypothetical protein